MNKIDRDHVFELFADSHEHRTEGSYVLAEVDLRSLPRGDQTHVCPRVCSHQMLRAQLLALQPSHIYHQTQCSYETGTNRTPS